MSVAENLLDVSAEEAPQPLVATLAAVRHLAPGGYLRMRHRMKPCLLYARIEPLGFEHDTRRNGHWCEVFIWRRGDGVAEAAARAAAAPLPLWQDD